MKFKNSLGQDILLKYGHYYFALVIKYGFTSILDGWKTKLMKMGDFRKSLEAFSYFASNRNNILYMKRHEILLPGDWAVFSSIRDKSAV